MIEQKVFQAFDEGKVCVFHNEVVARSYLVAYVQNSRRHAILSDQAISWDTFQKIFLPSHSGLVQVTGLIRQLFCQDFLTHEKLEYFIDKDRYPEAVDRFSSYIASVLPSFRQVLDSEVFKQHLIESAMERDIQHIYGSYTAFLEQNHLFEPLFERPSVAFAPKETLERHYVIFSGDAKAGCYAFLNRLEGMEGKIERQGALDQPLDTNREDLGLEIFPNYVAEQRTSLRRIASLLDDGVPPRDIMVTLTSFDDAIEDFAETAARLDIPLSYHRGKLPTCYPAGRFFKRIEQVYEDSFSLDSMKSFLLDPAFPFTDPSTGRNLIKKGVAYNVAHGALAREGDYWLDKLDRKEDLSLRKWYLQLKKEIVGICGSHTIDTLRKGLHHFQKYLFGEIGWKGTEGEDVYGYCMGKLDELEESLGHCGFSTFGSLYAQFIKLLDSDTYVPQEAGTGVVVQPYPLSASLTVPYHFVLGLNYDAAHVIDRPLSLLPPSVEDARLREEEDLTPAVLSDYCLNEGKCFFSYAQEDYRGAQLPPPFFVEHGLGKRTRADIPEIPDPYRWEEKMWSTGGHISTQEARCTRFQEHALAEASVSVLRQRKGCDSAVRACGAGFLKNEATRLCTEDGLLNLSSTSMDLFFRCRFAWALKYLLKIERQDFEIDQVDHKEIGTFLHKIYEKFFRTVEKEGGTFQGANLQEYRKLLKLIFDQEFQLFCNSPDAPMPATRHWLENLYGGDQLLHILAQEAEYFDGCKGREEANLSCSLPELGCRLSGKIDRFIHTDGENGYAVIDYKKGAVPIASGIKFLQQVESGGLDSYQFPIYRRLIMKNFGWNAQTAAYYSIRDGKFIFLWDEGCTADFLEKIDKLLDKQIAFMVDSVQKGDFRAQPSKKSCTECEYRQVCRLRYGDR
jgi:hypothetical protein